MIEWLHGKHAKLTCDLCGWEIQRKFRWTDINEHFTNAKQHWCPRAACRERYERIVPNGCVKNAWYDYNGWITIEEKPKIIPVERAYSTYRAKKILEMSLKIKEERSNHNKADD